MCSHSVTFEVWLSLNLFRKHSSNVLQILHFKNNKNIQILDGKNNVRFIARCEKGNRQRKFWQCSALEWRLAKRISRRLCDWFNQLSITWDLLSRVVAVKHIICCVKWSDRGRKISLDHHRANTPRLWIFACQERRILSPVNGRFPSCIHNA